MSPPIPPKKPATGAFPAKNQPLNENLVRGVAMRYIAQRDIETAAAVAKKEIGPQLVEYAKQFGEKNDKGTFRLDLETVVVQAIDNGKPLFKEAEAIAMLKEKRLMSRATKTIIDEDSLKALVQTGDLTNEEFASLYDLNYGNSYRVDVRKAD